METNQYWLLGVMHHQRPVILTVNLDDETIFLQEEHEVLKPHSSGQTAVIGDVKTTAFMSRSELIEHLEKYGISTEGLTTPEGGKASLQQRVTALPKEKARNIFFYMLMQTEETAENMVSLRETVDRTSDSGSNKDISSSVGETSTSSQESDAEGKDLRTQFHENLNTLRRNLGMVDAMLGSCSFTVADKEYLHAADERLEDYAQAAEELEEMSTMLFDEGTKESDWMKEIFKEINGLCDDLHEDFHKHFSRSSISEPAS